jgi:uncharacterized protein (DUF983 family)
MTAAAIFCLAYLGIALGKIPGLVIDRVGVAMLGAIAMVVFGIRVTFWEHAAVGIPVTLVSLLDLISWIRLV